RLNLRWKKISAIFISHTHADHVTGLPGLLMLSSQVERDDPLYIYGPPRIAEYIETSRRVLDMYINYKIIVKEITEGGIVYQSDDFHVRSFALRHTKSCFGYTLEEYNRPGEFHPERAKELGIPMGPLWGRLQRGNSITLDNGRTVQPSEVVGTERRGRKFSFITDSLYFPEIAGEVRNSDLLICEGMFEQELEADAYEKKHMTAMQAAVIARAAEVKQLGLIHYSPRYSNHELQILLDEAQKLFPQSVLTRDRMVFPLEFGD
ncbi:MAG: ribonuclease Z, partial [Spirochaetaceae bacterium]|nr:ribonuclease Z [Spirochaetaceae bacterium]